MVTILLADDSIYIKDLLKKIVAESGHNVIGEVANGDDAIVYYKNLRPEVVLMDIVLESGQIAKTGLDAIKEIISFDPQANIIVCSGLDDQLMINESMIAGAKAFIAKPIEPNKLLQTIINCSDLRVIAEMGHIGAERSASVLSKLAKQPIQVELLKLEAGSPRLLAGLGGFSDRSATIVKMGLQTKPNCDAFLVFEPSEATKIANIMTEVSERSENKELQMSAVKELGSNMICAFFAAVADFSELSLVPSPPSVSTNIFKTIFYDFLAQPTNPDNLALIFQIQLKQKTGSANGYFILIPTADFQRQLIDAGKKSFDINNLEKLD